MDWMQLQRGQLDAFDRRTPVILPTAAIEQHGEHLPLGTDCMIVRAILDRLDKAMDNKLWCFQHSRWPVQGITWVFPAR